MKSLTALLVLGLLWSSPSSAQSFRQTPGDSLEQRVLRLERLLDSRSLINMLQRLDAMERDLQRLRGDNELQQHRIDTLSRELQQLRDLPGQAVPPAEAMPDPQQETTLEGAATPVTSDAKDLGMPPSATDESAAPSTGQHPATQQDSYRQGVKLLRDGDYTAAITRLEAYLQRYPNGDYAGNARYWIGEAHYVESQFGLALKAFAALITKHPESNRIPDAMLKIGIIYSEQSQPQQARRSFEQLRRQFPKSTAAKLAGDRLKGL